MKYVNAFFAMFLAMALFLGGCNNGGDDGGGGGGGTPNAPEMDVLRGATPIADGGTDTLGNTPIGMAQMLTYTINNSGTATLNLTAAPQVVAGTGINCSVSVTTQPSASVAASGSSNFVISLTVSAAGAFSFTVAIANDDANENPYDFTASGTGATTPEIDVQRPAGTSIASGGNDALGGAFVTGANPAVTWTIANTGMGTLNLTGAPVVQTSATSNCSVSVAQPGVMALASSATTTFQITITVTMPGAFSFTFSIANDDSNENPYTVNVSGSVPVPAPEIDLQRPASTSIPSGGTDSLGSSFSVGPQAAITWTIANTGTAVLSLSGVPAVQTSAASNCTVVVTQPSTTMVAAMSTTTFQITITTLAAAAFSFNVSIANNDANENPYTFTASGTAVGGTPEIEVFVPNANVSTPSSTAMGVIGQDQTIAVPVMIRNTGGAALTISSTMLTPTNCTASVRDAAPASVAIGDTGVLVILVTAGTSGNPSLITSIGNNDSNENPFIFTMTWTLNNPTHVIYSSSAAFTSLVQAASSGAGSPLAINPAVTTGTGVGQYFHLVDRALFTCQSSATGDTDLFLKGLGASLPATPTNLTSTLSTTTGFFNQIGFTAGDNIVFTYNTGAGNGTRLHAMTINGSSAGTPVEISGTIPAGASGVSSFIVSPFKDLVLMIGDLQTVGLQEIFMVSVTGGTRTKLNGSLTGRQLLTNSIKWMPDQSGIVYETSDTSGQTREILFATAVASPVVTRLNGVVPAGRNGVVAGSSRLSQSGTHIFYVSDEASATGKREIYVVSRIGGTLSAQAGLNGASVPGMQGTGEFSINNTGTKVLFLADSGTANRLELFYSTIAGSTPTTTKIITSTTNVGVNIRSDAIVGNDVGWYTRDDNFNNSPELFYLNLSLASPTSTRILTVPAVTGQNMGIQTISTVWPEPDFRILFISDQGSFSGSGPRGNLFSATLSSTPGGVRLNNLGGNASPGVPVLRGNIVCFAGNAGSAPGRYYANAFGGGGEVQLSAGEVSGDVTGPPTLMAAGRVFYQAWDGSFSVASIWNANTSGTITRNRTDSAGLPAPSPGVLKLGFEPRP